jgi:uncharacterized protein
MTTNLERRYTALPAELRAKGGSQIGGYAAVFNRFSENLGGFVERVQPSFFNKSRGDGWPGVMARYNHEDGMLLGTTGGGTLRLLVDDVGLDYSVDVPAARADVLELVARGDVRGSSFAFRTYQDDWSTTDQGFPLRDLISGALVDVAPVNTPAYPDATAGLRSLATKFDADLEEVRSLAQNNELRRFFKRTDNAGPAKTGTTLMQARKILLDKSTSPYL